MNIGSILRYYFVRTPDRIASGSLRIHEFTALFAIDDHASVEALLDAQDEKPAEPYGKVAGIHHFRWYVFEPKQKTGDREREKPTALVLAIIFDGDTDDLLASLMHHAGKSVLAVLKHCRGFSEGMDAKEFLKERRIRSGFLFRDLGTLAGPNDDPDYEGDASVMEIDDARGMQAEFESFYDANFRERSPQALREKFMAAFGERRTTLHLTRFERAVPTEARYVRKVVELNRRTQDQVRIAAGLKQPLRGQHAKSHALVRARFEVDKNLDARFRHGVFAEPGAVFDAWIRPSNGSPERSADAGPDARGLTLRLEIDEKGAPWSSAQRSPGAAPKHQDFLLFSHPTFFAPDIKTFAILMSIFQTGTTATRLKKGVAYVLGSGKLAMLATIMKTLLRRVGHPLAAVFHSATPYLLGNDTPVKYSIEPRDGASLDRFAGDTKDPDFRRKALAASLSAGPIVLDFYVYAYAEGAPVREVQDAVEDASIDWTRSQRSLRYGLSRWLKARATKVRVGTLTLPRIGSGADTQPDPTTNEALEAVEPLQFNPWNGLPAHRPLGSLNRARWFIYRDSASRRAPSLASLPGPAPERANVEHKVAHVLRT